MPRPRTTNSKRDREIKKRIRETKKQEKAALKRQRREAGGSTETPGAGSEATIVPPADEKPD